MGYWQKFTPQNVSLDICLLLNTNYGTKKMPIFSYLSNGQTNFHNIFFHMKLKNMGDIKYLKLPLFPFLLIFLNHIIMVFDVNAKK